MPPSQGPKPAIVGAQGATSHIRDGLDIRRLRPRQRPVPPGITARYGTHCQFLRGSHHPAARDVPQPPGRGRPDLGHPDEAPQPESPPAPPLACLHLCLHAWSIVASPCLHARLLSPDPGADPRPGAGAGGGVFPLQAGYHRGASPAPARPNAATTATWTCPPPGPRPPPCCPCWRPSPQTSCITDAKRIKEHPPVYAPAGVLCYVLFSP